MRVCCVVLLAEYGCGSEVEDAEDGGVPRARVVLAENVVEVGACVDG